MTHWKRPCCWERLKAEAEEDDRRWDGWMALPTLWTWVWVGSESWCWTGRSGMLRLMGLQRVGHGWATELNWMYRCWELDYKKSWALKNWCFWTVVLGMTLESLLYCKEIKPVNPKGNQPWIFFGRTHAEAEAPILWLPDVKSWLIGKDPNAGKDWGQEEKGTTEDEIVGWHHRLNGHELEQALGNGEGQGSLVCYSP